MAESPTPPDRRARQLALGALVAGVVGLLVAVLTALGSGGDGGGPPTPGGSAATNTASARATTATTAGTSTTTTVAGPARDMGSSGPPRPVPVLAYQVINDPPLGSPSPELYVPRAEFAEQMQALEDAGYTAVTLREWWDSWHAEGPLPAKPVVVSFDDGYHSHLANALPVLRALGWPGVLNLALENVRSDYGLTEREIRALIDAGWELDSRTLGADARAELERRFGAPVDFLSYPAGAYDDAAIAAARAAGYLAATTEEPGLAQPQEADRYALPRVRVESGVDGAALAAQLDALS